MAPKIDKPHSQAQRLAELAELESTTFADGTRGWLAGAIHDRIIAKMEEHRAAERTAAEEIEAVLTSGLTGWALYQALRTHFGQATRSDVFLAAAMAMTVMEARATLAETETAIMRMERAA